MSGIAGFIDWRGAPVAAPMERALEILTPQGRDAGGSWDDGDVALGWRGTILTPEDAADHQPLAGRDGRIRFVFDGRIDNRAELTSALSLPRELARAWPDSRYALAAFEKWGADAPTHLMGDFAFAAWDRVRSELLLARDRMGIRPIYYHDGPRVFAFASHPAALFAHPDIPRAVDEATVAHYLDGQRQHPAETFFRGVSRLPTASKLRVADRRARIYRYWEPLNTSAIRFPRDDDYVEAFLERFDEAVRCRLRSLHPIGSHLSSGLDSTSVTATAARLLGARRLTAYTSVPLAGWAPRHRVPRQIDDEGPLAAMIAKRYPNIDHVLVHGPGRWDFATLDRYGDDFGLPRRDVHNAGWVDLLHRTARAAGVRVMLAAAMGNRTISFDGDNRLSALLREGHWWTLAREWMLARRHHRTWASLAVATFAPSLPPSVWDFVFSSFGRPRPGPLARTREARLEREYLIDKSPFFGHALRAWDIDLRDPTADSRIAEYCLAIPLEQFLWNGQSRRLVRRSMADRLPPKILLARARGRQAADWSYAAFEARDDLIGEADLLAVDERLSKLKDFAAIGDRLRRWQEREITSRRLQGAFDVMLSAIVIGRFARRVRCNPVQHDI